MASVIQPTYSEIGKDGQRRRWKAKIWYAVYVDHRTGKTRKKKGYIDKNATMQLAARLERESAQVKEGIRSDDGHSISAALKSYLQHLRAKGRSPKYIVDVGTSIQSCVDANSFLTTSDIQEEPIESWLIKRQQEDNISARTWNRIASAISSFCRFLVRRKTMSANPLENFPIQNEEADIRRKRRTISDDEVNNLIRVSRESNVIYYLAGPDRAILYTLACYTGYRVNELSSMTPANFSLDGRNPVVTIEAGSSKRRRIDTVPLHSEVANLIRIYIEGRPRDELLWPGRWRQKAAQMLRFDLRAANIPYKDDAGCVFDFHSLRGQFISMLALRGVSPIQLKELARHASIDTTLKHYTRLGIASGTESVEKLPSPDQKKK